MAVEDQRAAVGFSVTLSSQLIAASMAMLAVEAAYVWYALGSRSPYPLFEVFAALAGLAIVASIFVAGKGITAARNAGFTGQWSLDAGKNYFNKQAILIIMAILLLFVMFSLSGPVRESVLERRLRELETKTSTLQQEMNKLQEQQRIPPETGAQLPADTRPSPTPAGKSR